MKKTISVVTLSIALFFSACDTTNVSDCTDTNSSNTALTSLKKDSFTGRYDFHDIVNNYKKDIEMLYPYQISTIRKDASNNKAYIKFINKVPSALTAKLYKLGLENNFILTGGGGISQRDNQLRTILVSEALYKISKALHYKNTSMVFETIIYFTDVKNIIDVTMIALDESVFPDKETIIQTTVNLAQWSDLQGRASILNIDDIQWHYLIGEEHLFTLD